MVVKTTKQTLLEEAKKCGVLVEICKGRAFDDRGEITLTTPEGKCFAPELHQLVTEQNDDYQNGGLAPWEETLKEALRDLRENAATNPTNSERNRFAG